MTKQKIDIKNVVFLTILFLIIICGCIIKTYIWLLHTDFYCDESYLLLNIMSRNYLGLFSSLDLQQCCPPIFLIIGKLIYSVFGVNERALCSISLFASILSFFLFTFASFKIFKNKFSILFASLIFTFSHSFSMYGMFFKQYVTDILFSLIILLIVLFIKDKKLSNIQMFFLSLFCIFCVFCSYTAGFLIFSYALFFIFKSFKEKTIKQNLKPFLIFIIPFASVMVWFFFVNCLQTMNNKFLQLFWFDWEARNQALSINIDFFKNFICFFTEENDYYFYIFSFLTACSSLFLWKKNKDLFYILCSPFVFGFILGFFKLYPFVPERVNLYLLPFFVLLSSYFFEIFSLPGINKKSYCLKYSFGIIYICLVFYCLNISKNIYLSNLSNFDFSIFHNWDNNKIFVDTLSKTDIKNGDYIIGYGMPAAFDTYDINDKFKENMRVEIWDFLEKRITPKKGDYAFFWFYDNPKRTIWHTKKINKWIKNGNCRIIYQVDTFYGTLTKCEITSE